MISSRKAALAWRPGANQRPRHSHGGTARPLRERPRPPRPAGAFGRSSSAADWCWAPFLGPPGCPGLPRRRQITSTAAIPPAAEPRAIRRFLGAPRLMHLQVQSVTSFRNNILDSLAVVKCYRSFWPWPVLFLYHPPPGEEVGLPPDCYILIRAAFPSSVVRFYI